MQDHTRPPAHNAEPAHDLSTEITKAAQHEHAGLQEGLAKLALDQAPEDLHAGARLRNYFLTGLVVVGPVGITLYIAWNFIAMVDA